MVLDVAARVRSLLCLFIMQYKGKSNRDFDPKNGFPASCIEPRFRSHKLKDHPSPHVLSKETGVDLGGVVHEAERKSVKN